MRSMIMDVPERDYLRMLLKTIAGKDEKTSLDLVDDIIESGAKKVHLDIQDHIPTDQIVRMAQVMEFDVRIIEIDVA